MIKTAVLGYLLLVCIGSITAQSGRVRTEGADIRFCKWTDVQVGVHAGRILSGVVNDPNGAIFSKASLRLFSQAGTLITQVKSDKKGYFSFPSISPGRYVLKARSLSEKGFNCRMIEVEIDESAPRTLEVRLEPSPFEVTVEN